LARALKKATTVNLVAKVALNVCRSTFKVPIIIIIIIIIIILETVGLRVPNRNFRDFKLFHVNLNRRNCPSARCTSAANAISSDTCILNGRSVLISDLLLT
jgi:hypothetical protein